MPRPLPPALDWFLVSSFPPSQTESWGAATRDRKALFPWTCAWAPFLPRPRLVLASFQPFRMGRHLKTPLMCLETVSENAGHFSVCPHVAGSPFVRAVTSPRPFQSVFCPWWLQWPHPYPLQGSRVALAAPCSPEAWRHCLGVIHEGALAPPGCCSQGQAWKSCPKCLHRPRPLPGVPVSFAGCLFKRPSLDAFFEPQGFLCFKGM